MTQDRQKREALEITLHEAGVELPDGYSTIAHGDASIEQNQEVHRQTNAILLDLLISGELGTCIHVTGEMRALLDPLHRQICLEMHRRGKEIFRVIFNVPEERRHDSIATVGWSLSRWDEKKFGWKEQLRTVDVIGDRAVDLRAASTLDQIQYSVFGKKYILLQAKHQDLAPAKQLWLIESERLNDALTEKAKALFDAASEVDERGYRQFISALSGMASRIALRRLAESGSVSRRQISEEDLMPFEEDAPEAIATLEAVNFVKPEPGDLLRITDAGIQYLRLLQEQETPQK